MKVKYVECFFPILKFYSYVLVSKEMLTNVCHKVSVLNDTLIINYTKTLIKNLKLNLYPLLIVT